MKVGGNDYIIFLLLDLGRSRSITNGLINPLVYFMFFSDLLKYIIFVCLCFCSLKKNACWLNIINLILNICFCVSFC